MRRSSGIAMGVPCAALLGAMACGGVSGTAEGTTPARRRSAGAEESAGRVGVREPLRAPEVVVVPSSRPVLTLRVVFRAGSADDPPGKEGLTGLMAQVMAEGGAGGLSFAERSRRLFPMGGRVDVQVDRDLIVFEGAVHRDHAEPFYALFLEMLGAPAFAEVDLSRIRDRRLASLRSELRGSDEERLGKEALQALLYEGHPYGHPVLGTEEGLAGIGREDLLAQRRRVLCAGRAMVGAAGADAEAWAERLGADLVRLLQWEGCAGRSPLPDPPEEGPRLLILSKPSSSGVAISMGLPVAVNREHPDYPALVLAAAHLGQHRQFIGVLMRKIRGERGLNYGDYVYAEHFRQLGWSVHPSPGVVRRQQYMSVWLRSLAPHDAPFAVRLAWRALHRLAEEGMPREDFERVRRYVRDYYALFLQSDASRLGFAMDDRLRNLSEPWLERLRRAWDRMEPRDVQAAVRRHWPLNRLRLAMVHPSPEDFLASLLGERSAMPDYEGRPVSEAVRREDAEIAAFPVPIPPAAARVVPFDALFRARGLPE